jgi:hypothetical protein
MVRQQLADLLCGQGTDPDDCEGRHGRLQGHHHARRHDAGVGREVAQGLRVFGPNQGSLDADIAYLANLGITAKTDPYDYSRIIGPSSRARPGCAPATSTTAPSSPSTTGPARSSPTPAAPTSTARPSRIRPSPGQDYFDPEYDVLSSGVGRQPGSSFKPINYLIGIQDGSMTAASLFMDVATDFGGGYIPHDADGYERGPSGCARRSSTR